MRKKESILGKGIRGYKGMEVVKHELTENAVRIADM